ncbi:MAG: response regulator, partial [Anaerovoracaceae bacterium]
RDLAQLSYSIRTTLNDLNGLVHLIRMNAESPEKVIEYMDLINNSTDFLVNTFCRDSENKASGLSPLHDAETAISQNASLRVLIAEDNKINAEILADILEENHISYDLAEDGGEVVEKFRISEPGYYDVILMDITMPVFDGYEACRRIRSMERPDSGTVKIIACSANTMQSDIEKAKQAGMDNYLTKPIDIGMLLHLIHKL